MTCCPTTRARSCAPSRRRSAPCRRPPAPVAVAAPITAAAAAPTGPAAPAGKPVSKRVSINPFEKKKQIWPLLVIAALGGGAGVYLAVAPDAAPPKPVEEEPTPAKIAPPASAKPAKKRLSSAEERDACVI